MPGREFVVDNATLTLVINAFCKKGFANKVCWYFDKMIAMGLMLNVINFTSLIHRVCNSARRAALSKRFNVGGNGKKWQVKLNKWLVRPNNQWGHLFRNLMFTPIQHWLMGFARRDGLRRLFDYFLSRVTFKRLMFTRIQQWSVGVAKRQLEPCWYVLEQNEKTGIASQYWHILSLMDTVKQGV